MQPRACTQRCSDPKESKENFWSKSWGFSSGLSLELRFRTRVPDLSARMPWPAFLSALNAKAVLALPVHGVTLHKNLQWPCCSCRKAQKPCTACPSAVQAMRCKPATYADFGALGAAALMPGLACFAAGMPNLPKNIARAIQC